MPLERICQNEANLDDEKISQLTFQKKTMFAEEKFISGDEYSFLSLELKLKSDDITKWEEYDKIKLLSDLFNVTKETKSSRINLTVVVKLSNSISFENRVLTLIKQPEKNIYRYINTYTKKPIPFLFGIF